MKCQWSSRLLTYRSLLPFNYEVYMAQLIQKISLDVRNIEPMKSLMVVLGQEYDNLPESVKRALDPLLEDEEAAE